MNPKECWDNCFLCFVMMKSMTKFIYITTEPATKFITEFEGLCSEVYTFIKLKYNVGHVGIWL